MCAEAERLPCHACIVGERGDNEVPLWSAVHIAGIPLDH